MSEALYFARSGSGLRRLRLLAEGLDEAEEVHQMLCLPRRQRAPFCGHPWQRCNKILSGQMSAGGCGQGGDGAGAHRVCGGPASGQGLLLRGGEARRRRGVQCAGLRRHQALPPYRAGRGAGHHRPGDRRGHPGAAEGYDTVCTDGIFSQGEWQLLSIARAAAADPAVLLLDEITANLDAETEARVREALRQASRGRTVRSVSHRIYESLGGRTVEIRPQGQ